MAAQACFAPHSSRRATLASFGSPSTYASVESKAASGLEFSYRGLRETIAAIYKSKREHDLRSDQLRQPRQTMEQHLYSFLCKRHSQKSLVFKKAQGVFAALQHYAARDCDVAVFGKILQNNLDEASSEVQAALRQTVQRMMMLQVGRRFPHIPEEALEEAWRRELHEYVVFQDCVFVVQQLHSPQDSKEVLRRLVDGVMLASDDLAAYSPGGWSTVCSTPAPRITFEPFDEAGADPLGGSAGDGSNELDADIDPDMPVRYRDFVQLMLRCNLELREQLLSAFSREFRALDPAGYGSVNGFQALGIVARLAEAAPVEAAARVAVARAATEAALRKCALPRYTFSHCIELLTDLVSACGDKEQRRLKPMPGPVALEVRSPDEHLLLGSSKASPEVGPPAYHFAPESSKASPEVGPSADHVAPTPTPPQAAAEERSAEQTATGLPEVASGEAPGVRGAQPQVPSAAGEAPDQTATDDTPAEHVASESPEAVHGEAPEAGKAPGEEPSGAGEAAVGKAPEAGKASGEEPSGAGEAAVDDQPAEHVASRSPEAGEAPEAGKTPGEEPSGASKDAADQ